MGKDSVCSAFSQAALVAAFHAGADFSSSSAMVFNRNYQPLITSTQPTVVDLSDTSQLADVIEFWRAFSNLVIKHDTLQQFVDALVEISKGIVYVYDPPLSRYLKVKL